MDFLTNCVGYFSYFWGKIHLRRDNVGKEELILSYSLIGCGLWGGVWEQDLEAAGDIAFADRNQRVRIVTAQPGLPVESGTTARGQCFSRLGQGFPPQSA